MATNKTNIKSKYKPDTLSIYGETVYKRSNIEKKHEIDPVFDTINEYYTYDETIYSLSEWNHIKITKLEEAISVLQTEVDILKNKE